ncbi:MAG: response regulator [Planctomycetota bacterium]|nr:MAG: response regulator [Planctomycetota bacterium]
MGGVAILAKMARGAPGESRAFRLFSTLAALVLLTLLWLDISNPTEFPPGFRPVLTLGLVVLGVVAWWPRSAREPESNLFPKWIHATPLCVLEMDGDGCIRDLNQAARQKFEWIQPQDSTFHFTDLAMEADRAALKAAMEKAFRSGLLEVEFRSGNGTSPRSFTASLMPTSFPDSPSPRVERKGKTAKNLIAVCQENTEERRLAREQDRLRRRQQALVSLSLKALQEPPLQSFLHEVTAEVSRQLDLEFCKILKYIPSKDHFLLRAGVGWNEGLVGTAIVRGGTQSQAGFTFQSDGPVIVENFATEERFQRPALLEEHQIQSGFSVTISSGSEKYGVLGVHSRQPRKFSPSESLFLTNASQLIGLLVHLHILMNDLRHSQDRLETVLDGSESALWDWDMNTQEIWIHGERWAEMFGWATAEGKTRFHHWKQRINPDDWPEVEDILSHHLEGGSPLFEARYRFLDQNQDWRWVFHRGRVVQRDSDNRAVRFAGTAMDVTEQVQSEEEKRRLQEELQRVRRMDMITRLAGGVAHDFNNLLLVIMGNTELLEESLAGDSTAKEHLHLIREASERAAELTHRLLAFGRGHLLKPLPTDLNNFIPKVLELVSGLLPDSVVTGFRPSPSLDSVLLDRTLFEQMLVTLLVTSGEMMTKGGHLKLITKNVRLDQSFQRRNPWARTGPFVLLTVEIGAQGVAQSLQKELFDPLFATNHQGVESLGMATIYGIMEQHDGMIEIQDKAEEGTMIRLYLPQADPIAGEFSHRRLEGRGRKILLAEDEKMVRDLMVSILDSAGFDVLPCHDGTEAVKTFFKYQSEIALVLLDAVMPRLGGREAANKILEKAPETLILFTSGHSKSSLPLDFLQERNIQVLPKPFRPQELTEMVEKLLEPDSGEEG